MIFLLKYFSPPFQDFYYPKMNFVAHLGHRNILLINNHIFFLFAGCEIIEYLWLDKSFSIFGIEFIIFLILFNLLDKLFIIEFHILIGVVFMKFLYF